MLVNQKSEPHPQSIADIRQNNTELLKLIMILTAVASVALVSTVVLADNDCTMCESMQFTANGGLEIEYSRYMGEWMKVDTWDGRPLYACPGMDCQGLDRMMAWIDNQAWISLSVILNKPYIFVHFIGKANKIRNNLQELI